jgi:hypothetical protein
VIHGLEGCAEGYLQRLLAGWVVTLGFHYTKDVPGPRGNERAGETHRRLPDEQTVCALDADVELNAVGMLIIL